MRLVFLISLIFSAACSHKAPTQTQIAIPPHPCFKATAAQDLDYLQKNIEVCKTMRNLQGTTPLMLAAAKGNIDVISFLLQNGVDVNEVDLSFASAIEYAIATNKINSVDLLILSGIDLSTKKPDGITPLMIAVQQGSPQMIRSLTSTKQAINDKAEDGWTALYFAIRREDPHILHHLLRLGACKNVTDSYNQTPLDFAKEVGWKQGISVIENAPACGEDKSKKKK